MNRGQGQSSGRDMGSGQSNRGKGPKGFKRTDERLQEDISQRLSDDHELDASNIEVTVRNGEVTLQGTVTERRAKRLAEDLVEDISGVTNVENKIKVKKEDEEESGSESNERGNQSRQGADKQKNKQNAEMSH